MLDDSQCLGLTQRLSQIIRSTQAKTVDSLRLTAPFCRDDDGSREAMRFERDEKIGPTQAGHYQVKDNQIGVVGVDFGESLRAILRLDHFIAARVQNLLTQQAAHFWIVVNDQDFIQLFRHINEYSGKNDR